MIRKWLKFNTSFVELLKNSKPSGILDHYGVLNDPCKLHVTCIPNAAPTPSSLTALTKALVPVLTTPDPSDWGDGRYPRPDPDECAAVETPAETKLFQIKGPSGSAFLIEVHSKDLEGVKKNLIRLKGDFFRFDKAVLESFTMKCILAAEPFSGLDREQMRLAKVHAISSGCEEVYMVEGVGKFFFVNSVDNATKTKKILEKLGYKISGVMYRFQSKERIILEDRYRDLCFQFLGALEQLPKIISVTHNL